MNSIRYVPFSLELFEPIIELIDQESGKGFYTFEDLERYLLLSTVGEHCTSFVALDGQRVVGLRLTLAQSSWRNEYLEKLSQKKWPKPFTKTAYFKSNFISASYRGKGIGTALSRFSLDVLKTLGYEAVLCHSWVESPGNSSQKYLKKLGFMPVAIHEKFWFEVDYECVRCHPEKCVCCATEMLLIL